MFVYPVTFFAMAVGGGQTLIPQADGTPIGSMTGFGGLAAAFDSNESQINTNGARAAAPTGTIGKDWGSGVTHTVTGLVIIAPNNDKTGGSGGTSSVDINLRGSTDNFSGSNVDLGTQNTGANATGATYSFLSGWTATTAYRYHRITITEIGGDSGGSVWCCELKFYEG